MKRQRIYRVQLEMQPKQAAEFAAKMQDATRTTEKDMMGLMDVIQKGLYAGVDPTNMLGAFKNLGSAMDTIKMKAWTGQKHSHHLLQCSTKQEWRFCIR